MKLTNVINNTVIPFVQFGIAANLLVAANTTHIIAKGMDKVSNTLVAAAGTVLHVDTENNAVILAESENA